MTEVEKAQACERLASALMEFLNAFAAAPETPECDGSGNGYHTAKDLAEMLHKSENTIRGKIRSGEFGPDTVKDGRTYLVPESGLQFYYANHSAAYKPKTHKQPLVPRREVGRI